MMSILGIIINSLHSLSASYTHTRIWFSPGVRTHTHSYIPHSYSSAYFSITHCTLCCTIIITLKLFYDVPTKPDQTPQTARTHLTHTHTGETAQKSWLFTAALTDANIKAYCTRNADAGNHRCTQNSLKQPHAFRIRIIFTEGPGVRSVQLSSCVFANGYFMDTHKQTLTLCGPEEELRILYRCTFSCGIEEDRNGQGVYSRGGLG